MVVVRMQESLLVVVTTIVLLLIPEIVPLKAEDLDIAASVAGVKQVIAHRGASAERPECTLAAIRRAIEVGATAVEVDVRTSLDGALFILHDATLDRTTNGKGPANALTLADLQQLDAGSWFDAAYRNERIPSLIEATGACRGRIDLLLDLKEQGDLYDRQVVEVIKKHGDPDRTIVGVRSVAQALRFRALLPAARQLALIPTVDSIEAFAKSGVDTIRLWPRWLAVDSGPVKRVRATGKRLHLNGTLGEFDETLALLAFSPDSLSSDHPARLRKTLARIARGDTPARQLEALISTAEGTQLTVGESHVRAKTFLNRDYRMLELPAELTGRPRYLFHGGAGGQVRLKFRAKAVVFAALEYNDSGLWSFPDGVSPNEAGWHLWRSNAYRGSSNPTRNDQPRHASIWTREFQAGDELSEMPRWWLCLGIVDLKTAETFDGFEAGLTATLPRTPPRYSHARAAAKSRPLAVPDFESAEPFRQWQRQQRQRFSERVIYPYQGKIAVSAGDRSDHITHQRFAYQVTLDGQRLFRFFKLEPVMDKEPTRPRPTMVCFMGHGKVSQILDERDSYQHGCAARFAEAGYLVYAMENVGMEPGRDSHLDLDQSLRLEGYGWYSLLLAHQRILLDRVFADPLVDTERVVATGVSTGGLLALTAAVLEPRIAAASVQGIFGSMRISFIRDRHRHCACGAIPGLLPEFDLPELALLVAPRPLHFSHGQSDGFSPAEAARCLKQISPLYQLSGGQRPELTISPGGHAYAFDSALHFFQTAKPDANLPTNAVRP